MTAAPFDSGARPARDLLAREVVEALERVGIAIAADATAEALTGGVSSDIWRVDTGSQVVCVKRALATLRTETDWHAPVGRSAFEAQWLRDAAEIRPEFVPTPLAFDEAAGVIVLEYLEDSQWTVWKADLLAGRVASSPARRLGGALGEVHRALTGARHRYRNDEMFGALRLEPYLAYTAGRHPEVADALNGLISMFTREARTVVHGDVSPKNVLVGPDNRVALLDAECAAWGDPAFDLGFCLTHLCAKGVHLPAHRAELRRAAHAFVDAYAQSSRATDDPERLTRAGRWLPALLLARVDGRSPLEYLTHDERSTIRAAATSRLQSSPEHVGAVVDGWFVALD